jgi:hypothetical protein
MCFDFLYKFIRTVFLCLKNSKIYSLKSKVPVILVFFFFLNRFSKNSLKSNAIIFSLVGSRVSLQIKI